MEFTLPQWTDIFSAILRPQNRFQHDLAVLKEFQTKRADSLLPRGLTLQWLGTAGFKLTYQGYTLLIEPYLTRSTLRKLTARSALLSDFERIQRDIASCDAILVGHTHFDHALDVPAIARQFGCKAYGSSSLKHLMTLHGLGPQSVEVECNRVYEIGPFEVTYIASLHSKLLLGLGVPAGGELTCDHLDDLSSGQYNCGHTYGMHIRVAGTTFYHQGSANLIDDNIVHSGVDYFLAGIAGRGFTPRYLERILTKLKPKVIIPHHFDNFFIPLGEPTEFSLNINMEKFVDEVRAVSNDFQIRTLDLRETIER